MKTIYNVPLRKLYLIFAALLSFLTLSNAESNSGRLSKYQNLDNKLIESRNEEDEK